MYLFYFDNTRLPVTPSKLQIKINNQNKTMNLVNEGEINILKTPGLTDISFTCLLPVTRYPFSKYPELSLANSTISQLSSLIRSDIKSTLYKGRGANIVKPSIYLNIFEKLKTQCKSFKFTVIRTSDGHKVEEDTNFTVSLEDYTIKEDASDGSDMSVEVKLKQYKSYGTKTITIVESTATVTETRDTSTASTADTNEQYTIVKGDTLSGIAKRKLGSASRWKEIYELNKDTIEAAAKAHGKSSSCNGQWIYPGTVIQIPSS